MKSKEDTSFISKQVEAGDYYFLNLDPAPSADMTVVCGGREVCGEQYQINRTNFQYLSIEYVHSGTGSVTLAGEVSPLRPGSIFTYGPGIEHAIKVSTPMEKYFIDFIGKGAAALIKQGPLCSATVAVTSGSRRIHKVYEDLQHAGRGGQNRERTCRLLLELLILEISESALPRRGQEQLSWTTYQRCRDYMEDHFMKLETLEQVAEACHVSKPYLCRVFKRFDGNSPYQFLLRLKMERAAGLLINRQLLIKEVADHLGYEDQYHFSKVFKRVYGLSPDQFRKQRG